MKGRKIKDRLEKLDTHLANAEEYVARAENVESSSPFHMNDWQGKSGHPLWMKNHMIPSTEKARAKAERALERVAARTKGKKPKKR